MVMGSLEKTCLHVFKEAALGRFWSALRKKENQENHVMYI